MTKTVVVGIADYNTALAGDILVTYALGSCVGICLFDPVKRIAGMSHIMLPTVKDFTDSRMASQPGKYADTAIELLLKKMLAGGALSTHMRAKIAGGAQMFANINNNNIAGIGERNVAAVKRELARLRIPIIAEDTGKDYGRTLYFGSDDGIMKVKSVNKGEWEYQKERELESMANQLKTDIQQETGAGESEIMEFTIGNQIFGINVAEVREIMTAEPVTPMQKSNRYVEGIFKPRDKVITVINLSLFLELGVSDKPERDIYIITGFKNSEYAFHVHTVVGIDRITDSELKKPDPVIYGGREGVATGIVEHGGKLITILDFEAIIDEICPETEA